MTDIHSEGCETQKVCSLMNTNVKKSGARAPRRTFSEEFKADAVRMVEESGGKVAKIAVFESTLGKWVSHARELAAGMPSGPSASSTISPQPLPTMAASSSTTPGTFSAGNTSSRHRAGPITPATAPTDPAVIPARRLLHIADVPAGPAPAGTSASDAQPVHLQNGPRRDRSQLA